MRLDQNRIELRCDCGYYEKFRLESDDTATLLPGALVDLSRLDDSSPRYVTSQAVSLDNLGLLVVIENGMTGKGIHAQQYSDQLLLARKALPNDIYLLRAVKGNYYPGQPLYATQTSNGIYVSPNGEGRFVGWCQENYTITESMMDIVDESSIPRAASFELNGILVNLVKVRISLRSVPNSSDLNSINFTPAVTTSKITGTKSVLLTFASALADDLILSDIDVPSTDVTIHTITKIDSKTYKIEVTSHKTGLTPLKVNKTGINKLAKIISVVMSRDLPKVLWGVCYPDARISNPTATPTATEITNLTGLNELTESKHNLDLAFTLNETDWHNAGGTGDFKLNGSGRAFLITQNWGNASSITTNYFNVGEAFNSFTIEIEGVMFSGYIANDSPVVYDGSIYNFEFPE